MPGTTGPNLGLTWGWAPHEDGWGVGGFNPGFAVLDTMVQLSVIARTDTPPGSPTNGVRYVVGDTPTGAWVGHANQVAAYLTTGAAGWQFYGPKIGWRAWVEGTSSYIRFTSTGWVADDLNFLITAAAAGDVLTFDVTAGKFINVRPMRGVSFGSDPAALLLANQQIFYHRFGFPFRIPADFGDYLSSSSTIGGTAVAADGDVVLRVQKALTAAPLTFANVGTITVGTGTVNATFASSATPINFAKGDVLRILAPATPDSGFTGPYGTIVGYEI